VCESVDFIALDRSMVEPKPGDLLAITSGGAYGAVEASTYNTRALIPEVLVRKGEWALMRPRRADRARSHAGVVVIWRRFCL
jgi:diaminopimelate decarboxylase